MTKKLVRIFICTFALTKILSAQQQVDMSKAVPATQPAPLDDSTANNTSANPQTEANKNQSFNFKGRILEKGTGIPLKEVNVFLLPLKLKTQTNNLGDFNFENLTPGEYQLVLNLSGFKKDVLIGQCRDVLTRVRSRAAAVGTSLGLTYLLRRLEQSLLRLATDCTPARAASPGDRRTPDWAQRTRDAGH